MNTKTEYSLQEAFETLMLYFPYNATLGCLVILLNSFIFYFYHKQYRKFVPCMYLLLALLDCLMIIFMIIFYCLVFKLQCESSDPMLEHKWVIIGFKMGEKWSLRMSIFINTLLSVARTLKTIRPFSKIKMKKALLSVVLYNSFWIVFIALDVFSLATSDHSAIDMNHKEPGNTFERIIIDERVGGEALSLLPSSLSLVSQLRIVFIYFIPYVLPVLVYLVSATVMIVHLRKEPPSRQSASTQRHVSVTVLLITISFVLCLCVPALYDLAIKITKDSVKSTNVTIDIGTDKHVLESTVPLVNALISPAIMIWRSSELRGRVRRIFRRSMKPKEIENFEMQQF